jgi:hypothetical protein
VDAPVVLVGNVEDTVLAGGRVDAASEPAAASGARIAAVGSIMVGPGISVRARHYARRGTAMARLPIMADLLLPGSG